MYEYEKFMQKENIHSLLFCVLFRYTYKFMCEEKTNKSKKIKKIEDKV